MIYKKFYFALVLFVLGHFSPVFSQKIALNITSLNSLNGLSQNSVQCILKDKYGFMWFGTQDGLNKYDGFKFEVYHHSNGNPTSLPSSVINTVCEDDDTNIWVGTDAGLAKYIRSKDLFVSFIHNSLDRHSISNDHINIAYKDKQSNIWIGTANGLDLYDKKTGRFKHFYNNISDGSSLSDSYITSIFEDNSDNVWIGTAKGLNLLDRKTGKSKRFLDQKDGINIGNNCVNAIVNDDENNIWTGTNNGLSLLNKDKATFTHYSWNSGNKYTNKINPIITLAKTKNNNIWIGTTTTLQLFDVKNKQIVSLVDTTDDENRLPNDGIYSILEDQAGILWIGTTSEGIAKFNRSLTVFPSYVASPTNNPSAINVIRGIGEDKIGNFYLCTDAGLKYFNRKNNSVINLNKINNLLGDFTSSIVVTKKKDAIWVGSFFRGLGRLDLQTGSYKSYKRGNGPSDLSSNVIYGLMEDRNGNIWIGTVWGGVNVFDIKKGTILKYLHDPKRPGTVCDNNIETFLEDRNGNIWIGGVSKGISIYNIETKCFSQLNSKNSNLSCDAITSFYEDSKGDIWVGTKEGGLNCYDQETHKFKIYSEQNGLISNAIYYITQDNRGYLWLSSLKGISRFDPGKVKFKNFNYYNGLKSLEFNGKSGVKLKSGEIVLGSINGFNIIDPNNLHYNNNKPAVAITDFELFNKHVVVGSQDSPLKQNIATTKEIKLRYSQSVFTITFAALDYTVPENNKYAYKLEGFDKEWRYVGNQHSATYTNLNPGTYTFKVKAANNDDIWSNKATAVKVIIVPPYWMTWPFRAVFVLLIVGGAYSFYLYRVNSIKKQKTELENQVKIRTLKIGKQASDLQNVNTELQLQKEELQTQSEELQSQKEELQVLTEELQSQSGELIGKTDLLKLLNEELTIQKSQEENARVEADKANLAKSTFLATMSHEIRTPMNGVLGMAALLSETQLDVEQSEYTDAIVKSGESLLMVINDILDFSKIESGKLELDPHNFNLRKCIEDVLELFASKAAAACIDLVYQIEDVIPNHLIADSLRLRQVLTNLVGNAIKFTRMGEIFVDVSAEKISGKYISVRFKIRDTGIGIPESKIGNLFQAFNQVDSSVTRKYGGTGLGLVICDRLVKLMGGDIKVTSKESMGSTFIFSINCQIGTDLDPFLEPVYESDVFKEKKVLVIDDNGTNLKMIQTQLKKWKMDVIAVSSGKKALEILSVHKDIDLVITDMQMPDMDGIELSTHIKILQNNIPIILLSSIGSESKKTHSHLFTSVLTKPVKQQKLFQVIALDLKKEVVLKIEEKKACLSEKFALDYPFTILVAEDNLINQKLIIRVLNKLGYKPDLVCDGQEVMDMMLRKTYELILMDMQMPKIDGLEATRLIREIYGKKPLIAAMTANVMSEDKESCFFAGMDDYISKPINIEALKKMLMESFEKLNLIDKENNLIPESVDRNL